MGGTRDADADARSWIATTVSESIGVTGTDGAGVSLASDGGAREVLIASDGIAGALEQLQFALGDGPCIDAAVTGSTVLADDLSGGQGLTDGWPAFAREAAPCPVRVPDPDRSGPVRNLRLLPHESRIPGYEAAHCGAVHGRRGGACGPRAALERPGRLFGANPDWKSMTVHRTAGMVMVQTGSSIEEALLRLRATAYADDIPISEVATAVVAGRRRFPKERA